MLYGLEKEYFVTDESGEFCLAPRQLPYDECGYLVEARGKARETIREAVYSLMAEEDRLLGIELDCDYTFIESPIEKIPRGLLVKASRYYKKGLTQYQNMYGHEFHANTGDEKTAGIHISFTNPRKAYRRESADDYMVNEMFDYIKIFRALDIAFEKEIKKSKRKPGFYEIKCDGRIEYRSLPNDADLHKIIEVVEGVRV